MYEYLIFINECFPIKIKSDMLPEKFIREFEATNTNWIYIDENTYLRKKDIKGFQYLGPYVEEQEYDIESIQES